MPNDQLFTPEPQLPFDEALVEYTDGWIGHLMLAVRVARTVHVLVTTDVEEKDAIEEVHRAGYESRARITLRPGGPAVHLETLKVLDVVVTDAANFEFFAKL